jgi:acylphosphatase
MPVQRAHLVVEGVVQGVCFRHFCRREALRLGLTGWVRNRRDGSVEAVAEGPEDRLREFADWCRHGPSYARVDALRLDTAPATGEFASFEVVG